MGTVTKTFAGTNGDDIDVYDTNFKAMWTPQPAGDVPEIYNPAGEAELRCATTYDRSAYYYDQGDSGGDQTATIIAKLADLNNTSTNNTGPAVRCLGTAFGYYMRVISDGTTITAASLWFWDGAHNSVYWLSNIELGLSLDATTSRTYTLSVADNGSNQPVFSAVIEGAPGSPYTDFYTDTVELFLTGQPGLMIYSDDTTTGTSISSFTSITTSSGSSIPMFMNQHGQLNGGTI